jgi:hypothetical protein
MTANSDERERLNRRETTIDTMASWALGGMEPSPQVLDGIRAYVDGTVTLDEALANARARYRLPELNGGGTAVGAQDVRPQL